MKVKDGCLGNLRAWNSSGTLARLRTRMGGFQLRCIPPYQAMLLGPERCVSYVWAGSSRRKRRGRAEAVLTCKSFVRPGYRGERLIEASGSWFTPKFLLKHESFQKLFPREIGRLKRLCCLVSQGPSSYGPCGMQHDLDAGNSYHTRFSFCVWKAHCSNLVEKVWKHFTRDLG